MIKYYITESFTLNNKGGNPAGVVYLKDTVFDDNYMQRIARELDFSETAFIMDSKEINYDYYIRFFTPTEEVNLCGHATIASFYILSMLKCMERNNKDTITLKQKTGAGILEVELKYNNNKLYSITMEQGKPKIFKDDIDLKRLANIFGINADDIGIDSLQPRICSTGLKDIIMPVKDVEVIRNFKTDFNDLAAYSKEIDVVGVHAFTFKDRSKGMIECRNFAPAYGINEESATGTSNGALGAYLVDNNIYNNKIVNLSCIQGVSMNNESKIDVTIINEGYLKVKVGGMVTLKDQGYIKL